MPSEREKARETEKPRETAREREKEIVFIASAASGLDLFG